MSITAAIGRLADMSPKVKARLIGVLLLSTIVAGKLLVLPMRPGAGTVSILLVGSMMGGRSGDGD